MRNLVRLLPAFSLLMVLSLGPAHAQVPNLGDLGNLFKKNKSKTITVTVNGNPTGNAIQEKGVVYVPLSVLQSLPGVSSTLNAAGTNVTITTSAPGSPNSVQVINGVQTVVPPPGTVRGGGLLGQIEGDASAGDPAARAAPIKAPAKFDFHVLPGVSLDTHSLSIYHDALGQFVVRGIIKNISSQSLPQVCIDIAFIDADGNRVSDLTTLTSDLSPGDTWKFKVGIVSSLVKTYKILWISDNVVGPSVEKPSAAP